MDVAALEVAGRAPTVIVKERLDGEVECAVVCEGRVLCVVPGVEVPLVVLSAYYAFNMEYPAGLKNLLTFLGIVLFDIVPKKKLNSKLTRALSYYS